MPGAPLTKPQRMYSRERTALVLPSFQYRLQTAAVPSYKKLNKKGELKVILTDDTLHRKIFYLAKSKSYSPPLHIFTRHKLLDVTPPFSTIPPVCSQVSMDPRPKQRANFLGQFFSSPLFGITKWKSKGEETQLKSRSPLKMRRRHSFCSRGTSWRFACQQLSPQA